MREAAIDSRRGTPRSRPSRAPGKEKPRRRWMAYAAPIHRVIRRHPSQVLAIIGCTVMVGSIVGNAMLFQTGRHPAPLFGHSAQTRDADEPVVGAIPAPAPRPIVAAKPEKPAEAVQPSSASVASAATPTKAVPPPMSTQARKSAPARKADAIARLLGSGDKTPVGTAGETRIASAQRSLGKLGFAIKPDGRMGASTRQALETFERDHQFPVGGDLSPKLLHELVAAAAKPRG